MMIDYSRIPESTIETLTAWIQSGRPMGSFCEAVVANDLREACARADESNARALFDIVAWLYNHAPIRSWGSPEALEEWPLRFRPKPREKDPNCTLDHEGPCNPCCNPWEY